MNRLASAPSSYLRSAAHQPIDWHPWGAEAFAKAKAEDKPILLDIGAVWCHWCHVMDRESYENEATAAIVNRLFVAVKVDRDERPDVDARYQKAIQAMTGQGGWPLTAFLLPDGRCFYGGTYFPPVDAHGRPSFPRVLEAVAGEYRERRDKVLAGAADLQEWLAKRTAPRGEPAPRERWPALLDHAIDHVLQDADLVRGGFGGAPKFPHPTAIDLLLRAGDGSRAKEVATLTLESMRAGGVYDQLAGGFHRYSVDAEWIVPHFEKMLYDNAGLLRSYARGAAALGEPAFARTASEIKAFLRDVLQRPEGGFGGSQDADVDTMPQQGADASRTSGVGDDGDHFTWTLDELREAVGDEALARLMAQRYGIREKGDMHHDPRRCVLRIAADVASLAAAHHKEPSEIERDLARGDERMRAARARRKVPFVDPTRYVSWNAMAIQALLEHGGLHGDAEADRMALAALDALLATAYEPGRGFARTPGSSTFGLLDDDAQMLDALVEAHLATGDGRYLRAAREVADLVLDAFPHEAGGFADRAPSLAPPAEGVPLASPERPIQDAPTPSANGVAIRGLLRLAEATGEERYRREALRALDALAPEAARLALFGGALLLALDEALAPPPRIVVKGELAWARPAARRFAPPGAVLVRADDAGAPPEARALPGEGVLVCLGVRCLAPARTPDELRVRLAEAADAKPQIPL